MATLQFNPLDPELIADRHAVYRRLREAGPVHFEPALGTYFVWGHEEALTVLRNPGGELHFAEFQATRLPAGVIAEEQPYCQGLRYFLLAQTGDDHSRVRRTFARHFTPTRVAAMDEQITAKAAALVDGFRARGNVEIMEAFALPLPLSLISSLLGISETESARIAGHLRHFKLAIQLTPLTRAQLDQVNAGFVALEEIFTEIIADRRANPGEDLLSMLIAEEQRGELSEAELFAAAWGLYAAGHESTAGFTGLSLLTLLDHPEQLDALRADPALVSAGPHKCAGQHLARATLRAALNTLVTQLPNLRLAGEVGWDHENLPIITAKRIPLAWDT